jgi:hypothetical protein
MAGTHYQGRDRSNIKERERNYPQQINELIDIPGSRISKEINKYSYAGDEKNQRENFCYFGIFQRKFFSHESVPNRSDEKKKCDKKNK